MTLHLTSCEREITAESVEIAMLADEMSDRRTTVLMRGVGMWTAEDRYRIVAALRERVE